MKKLSTERWLGRMVKSQRSQNGLSLALPYFTHFFAPIYLSRATQPETPPTTAAHYAKPGRCTIGLQRLEDHSSPPETVRRSARRLQNNGRLSAHQFLTSRGMHSLPQVVVSLAWAFVEAAFFAGVLCPNQDL